MWLGLGRNRKTVRRRSSLAWAGLDTSSTGQAGSGSRWCKTDRNQEMVLQVHE